MKKTVILSAIAGLIMCVGLTIIPVGAKAQATVVEDTLIQLTQQLITLVQAISANFSQQFALQDTRITTLENRIHALEAGSDTSVRVDHVSNPSTSYSGLSTADQDAISALTKTLPDTVQNACQNDLKNNPTRRSTDRIFRLMCEQVGL